MLSLLFWIGAVISWALMLIAAVLFCNGAWRLIGGDSEAIYVLWTAFLLMLFGGAGHQYLFHV